jgi:ABC-type multidrug transport system fused ATPase/permease subunit
MAVLVITRAVEMMRICQKIVVLEAGRIPEVGSFEELKEKDSASARLNVGYSIWGRRRERHE